MYLQNKYSNWYYNIISAAKSRPIIGYVERHHIIPKSLGGNNTNQNLISLTAREHFICHWLLPKMTEGKLRRKMISALSKMCQASSNQQRYKISGRKFEQIRKLCSESMTGSNNPMFGSPRSPKDKLAISAGVKAANAVYGPRVLSDDHKHKIGISKIGKTRPQWLKDQWSLKRKGRPGQDNNSGKHFYNNGVENFLVKECPAGCVPGKLTYAAS
jgi:hypothetical protein